MPLKCLVVLIFCLDNFILCLFLKLAVQTTEHTPLKKKEHLLQQFFVVVVVDFCCCCLFFISQFLGLSVM